MRALVRWAGSKQALLPILRKQWVPGQSRYVEPFCGSAKLFFDLEPKDAILGDINEELIKTYRALKRDASRVVECLLRYKISKRSYYAARSIDPTDLSDVEIAARFLFLNRLSFNGIYRTNRAGIFNVPYARPKAKVRFDPDLFIQAASLLKRATLIHGDFERVLSKTNAGDFVYLDPPYAVSARRVFSEYHPDSFSTVDLERLDSALQSLDQRGVSFVLSYADSAEGRSLVKRWNWKRVRTRRNVAGFAGDRRFAYELLASNVRLAS